MDTEAGTPQKRHVAGIIPARWGSTRFPGKPLHLIAGKALVQHVWDQCQKCRNLDSLLIATDDERIAEACRGFGADVAMTSPEHPSGSDRIAEILADRPAISHAINIQGDEPLIAPELVDELAGLLAGDPNLEMVSAASPITSEDDFQDPNIVKVVLNEAHEALYFSRSPIPHFRDGWDARNDGDPVPLRHIGIYGYRADFLEKFLSWPAAFLEQAESLEQLRALSHGTRIRMALTDHVAPGVDTPEQARLIETLILSST